MKQALHAEWTKLRTAPGTGWVLVAIVVLTVGVSAAAAAAVDCAAMGCSQDPVKISLTGITVGQAVVVMLAVMVIGGEYSTGMIRTTLTAMPRRWTALAAKAVVVCGVVLVAAIPAVLGSLVVGRMILPGSGFTAAHGFGPLSLADGPTLRATVGSILYLVLVAGLSLGVATVLRDAATAVGVGLALLYFFPILAQVVQDPDWRRHLEQIAPMTAGFAIQATIDLQTLPISPWKGLGVVAGWAVGALLGAAVLLRRRDA
jgi:ABC-2 type transport system permease protein